MRRMMLSICSFAACSLLNAAGPGDMPLPGDQVVPGSKVSPYVPGDQVIPHLDLNDVNIDELLKRWQKWLTYSRVERRRKGTR